MMLHLRELVVAVARTLLSCTFRAISGALALLLALFAFYTVLLYTPGGPQDMIATHGPSPGELLADMYELDKPWPVSFLAYMFDPSETVETVNIDRYTSVTVPKGIHVSILGAKIEGSGLATGDFGKSFQLSRGDPVMDVYGPGLDVALALVISLIVTFMYVAMVQRIGRPAPYITRQPRTSAYTLRRSLDPASFSLKG
ncbi:MAG TPA: hypothetical protein VF952_01310 [Chloroflexia bacterium]